jgi:protein ImuB
VLVECLRGRFGRDGVCGLQLRAEHRPELAFRQLTGGLASRQNGKAVTVPAAGERPLWLLPEPVRLADDVLRSMACTDRRPERIESGWWDGDDVQRDYYAVTTREGERWWVYRDRATREWHLHGVFG